MQKHKRKLVKLLFGLPIAWMLSACKADAMGKSPPLSETQRRFKDMGLALVVDAVEGAQMLGVEFVADDQDSPFYAKSRMVRTNREIMAFPSGTVPEHVRVVWRKKHDWGPYWWISPNWNDDFGRPLKEPVVPHTGKVYPVAEIRAAKVGRRKLIAKNIGYVHQGPWGGDYFGEAAGDYTIPIASRIPDEVVNEIRRNGGGLRLKFRLKPDGVMFGWDIERFSGGLPRHSMPGGDFLQTEY